MESNGLQAERPSAEAMSAFQRMIAVFTSPGKAFASIDLKPTLLAPLLVTIAVNLVFVFLAGDIATHQRLELQRAAMEERGADAEQIDQAMEMGEKMAKIFGPVFSAVWPLLVMVVVSAVFLFVGNVVLGGKTTFKKIMSVTAYSRLIQALYALLILPIVLTKKTMLVTFSLASFMPDEKATTFLYQLLSTVDVFYIWWIAVFSIGLAVIYKMKTQKMATAVISVYAIYAIVAAAIGSLFS